MNGLVAVQAPIQAEREAVLARVPRPVADIVVAMLIGNSSLPRATELKDTHLARHEVTIRPPIPADPTTGSVQDVLDSLRLQPPDWVIAMGGGSVLDTAKAAALLTNHEGTVAEYLRGERELTSEGIPVVAVPTTAGSGSEVTPYASITDTALGKKVSLTHDSLFPKFAVMDASLTLSLAPENTAVSFQPVETGQQGEAVLIRIPGSMTISTVSEYSTFAPGGRERVVDETMRWF